MLAECFTSWERPAKQYDTPPDEVALMMPKMGGRVLPTSELPDWVKNDLERITLAGKPN